MNVSTLIGFSVSILVFVVALFTTTKDFGVFLDFHAVLVVIGGTLAASFVCFSYDRIFGLTRVFARRMLGKTKRDYLLLIEEVAILATAYRKGKQSMPQAIGQITDLFLRDAAQILVWLEAEVPEERLRRLLETRAETHFERYLDEANIFRTIAKFPPAFGLMGTTLGMIALLQSLGNPEAKNLIGPSMSIALVATLYGIVLANFVFIPIAENLTKQSKEDLIARRIVVESIMSIAADLPSKFVEEQARSFLLPGERGVDPAAGKKAA
jgi:chemotaxis protein MotA